MLRENNYSNISNLIGSWFWALEILAFSGNQIRTYALIFNPLVFC